MELRESGMPVSDMWEGFFDPEATLRALSLLVSVGDIADLCCGYGTFSVAAARLTGRTVHAVDISVEMAATAAARVAEAGDVDVRVTVRDLVVAGCGLGAGSTGYAMLFNILHCECPETLLAEAFRILAPGGLLAVTHWVSDRPTPRGPSAEIRPTPEQCREWAEAAGFRSAGDVVDLPPYHFGLVFVRP